MRTKAFCGCIVVLALQASCCPQPATRPLGSDYFVAVQQTVRSANFTSAKVFLQDDYEKDEEPSPILEITDRRLLEELRQAILGSTYAGPDLEREDYLTAAEPVTDEIVFTLEIRCTKSFGRGFEHIYCHMHISRWTVGGVERMTAFQSPGLARLLERELPGKVSPLIVKVLRNLQKPRPDIVPDWLTNQTPE
jgi:hypothetical protein